VAGDILLSKPLLDLALDYVPMEINNLGDVFQ
jgi:hypothetical protein